MGRKAYLARLALGRSALEPPEDSETFTAARAGEWTSALHAPGESAPSETEANASSQPPPHGVQLYDRRGHPFNPWARRFSRRLRDAQNDILSVIGVTERKTPVNQEFFTGSLESPHVGRQVEEEDDVGWKVGLTADIDYQLISWWIHALTNRLLVFFPTENISFVEVVRLHRLAMGMHSFMFAGLPSFMLGHLMSPEILTSLALDYLDREIWARVSSRRRREAYVRYRFIFAVGIEVFLNLFVLPLRVHSILQILGFAPDSFWLLPPPRSWLPFCGDSLIQWNADIRHMIPFFMFRPISSLVHQYLFKSFRPSILGPTEAPRFRRSSSQRLAASITSAPIIELPHEETTLTPFFNRLFCFLGWGRPLRSHRSTAPHFQPLLRRRETWSINQPIHSGHDTAVGAEQIPPEASIEPTAQASIEPVMPHLERVHTSATLGDGSPFDRDHDRSSDATIRVSSIGPDGAVNLEIGLPEDTRYELAAAHGGHANDAAFGNGGVGDSFSEPASTGRRNDMDLYEAPHHISKLALEPTELLVNLTNVWVAGWLLMPVRVFVLRGLVRHVIKRPTLFGVDPTRAWALPTLLGSDASVLTSGFVTSGMKHVALASLVDVSLGLGYWLLEWSVVRFIGVSDFGWGTF
ncbi:uncharacterized protein PV09_05503 [Verruconis gallopava]|uniref:Uncharacterized protein n=1 Tax=Verruconis gallopava TaxID=253628 RepID=A0A0D2A9K7_9PEZI|nr:uncharacterized protein PV09_05503 [Verruconis gallopava]KIW03290.1 hypothetical protein PV09_05503 [Verruconis gallopava]